MKKEKNKKEVDEATFKSFDGVDLSKIPGSATYILTQNWERFNDCKTAEDVVMLCHELFDKSSLDTQWARKFFYTLDNIIQQNPNPRRAFEQAMYFVGNTKLRGEGLGMNRRRMYECDGKQYSREQIMEAIKHWQGVLESLGESESDKDKEYGKMVEEVKNHLNKASSLLIEWRDKYEDEDGDETFLFDFDDAMAHFEALDDII